MTNHNNTNRSKYFFYKSFLITFCMRHYYILDPSHNQTTTAIFPNPIRLRNKFSLSRARQHRKISFIFPSLPLPLRVADNFQLPARLLYKNRTNPKKPKLMHIHIPANTLSSPEEAQLLTLSLSPILLIKSKPFNYTHLVAY